MKDELCKGCPYEGKPYVGAEGPKAAPIAIIGEAPGEKEELKGRPFIGRAGKVLDLLLKTTGIDRKDCYITNVMKCHPVGDKLTTQSAQTALSKCLPRFLKEMESIRARVIVPTGNTALHALGITHRIGRARGSITMSPRGKIIPTWHPAYIGRQWQEFLTGVYDWNKIKRQSLSAGYIEPAEYFTLNPSIYDIEKFVMEIEARTAKGENVVLGIDLETYMFDNPLQTPIKLVGIATTERTVMVIPFITQSGNYYWPTHDESVRAVMAIGRLLENPRITKMCHHALFDILVLMNHGWDVVGPIYDTMIGHFLVYHLSAQSLEYLVSIYADYQPWKLVKGNTDEEFRTYNARDAAVLQMIKPPLDEDMESNHIYPLFEREMTNILPTCRMMLNGMKINTTLQAEVGGKLKTDIATLQREMETLAKWPGLNPRSHPQLEEVLFKRMKLKSQVKTKGKGRLSTDEAVLKKLSLRYPDNRFVDALLEYRTLQIMDSTFIRPPVLDDGRVHSQFKRSVITGRFASSGPNLQNLPSGKRGEKGEKQKYIRKLYVPDPGHLIIACDLSQAELVVFAVIANDPIWLKAFAEGDDIHAVNCTTMLGYYDPKYRTFIKNFIFGLIYGSAGGEIKKVAPRELMEKISVDDMLAKLLGAHPRVKEFYKTQEDAINKTHKVKNPFGRTRHFVGRVSQANVREGVNFPITSTVSEIMTEKMATMDEELAWPTDRIILQLHDALYVETPKGRADIVAQKMKEIMEQQVIAPSGHVFNLKAEVEIGPSLGDLKKYASG